MAYGLGEDLVAFVCFRYHKYFVCITSRKDREMNFITRSSRHRTPSSILSSDKVVADGGKPTCISSNELGRARTKNTRPLFSRSPNLK